MKVVLAILLCASSAAAQAVPAARVSNPIRLLSDVQIGGEPGYKLPYIQLGGSVEIPIGNRFEAQFNSTWSPTAKQGTSSGYGFQVQTTEIGWVTQRFGLTGNVRHNWLRTDAYHKQSWEYSAGVVFRAGDEHRIYLDYLLPYGDRGFNPKTGIEDSHTQGPEIQWEVRMANHWRWIVRGGVYHVLTQGNQLCDGTLGPVVASCKRGGAISAAATVGFRYEWPGREGGW
jgi:hypothetical protein